MSLRPHYQSKKNSTPSSSNNETNKRGQIVLIAIMAMFTALIFRLFAIQILSADEYQARAQEQYSKTIKYTGSRGKIFTADDFLLVGNDEVYRLYVEPQRLEISNQELFEYLTPILDNEPTASWSGEVREALGVKIDDKRNRKGVVNLVNKVTRTTKEKILELDIYGIGFDSYEVRYYPEASMAAHTTGFVGKDADGNDQGYFGIEGALDKELRGRFGKKVVAVDAKRSPIYSQQDLANEAIDGRDVYLTLRRDIQNLLEKELEQGIKTYGARRGEIIVSDPKTGKILGMATYPTYNAANFNDFPTELYKNPAVADTFEPGSIFKVLTVAAGIDSKVISPYTSCTNCSAPRQISGYTIRTWNDVYNPGVTMTDALAKSDNVAMIFIAELLGKNRFESYLKDFGVGSKLGIDLQEDFQTGFPTKWGDVELATRSFGQGITVNSIQMVQAVSAVANGGWLMKPLIVEKAIDHHTGEIFSSSPERIKQVVSAETAQTVSLMMRDAAKHGEAQYIYKGTDRIAGKTGTAQVAKASGGGYEEHETLVSFIGFAPYDDPAFVMYVKMEAPSSSPWAAETAAPLWNKIAEKLFIMFNINEVES